MKSSSSSFLLLLLFALECCLLIQTSETKEYCQFETFNVTCPPSQIIIMEEARYGRLQLGRCVTRDYGFLGCSASVLDLLDRSCSGQRSCQFSIPTLRDLVQPCPKDLTSYLEASYTCVTVLEPSIARCNETVSLDASSSFVYLHYLHDSASSSSSPAHPPSSSSPAPSAVLPIDDISAEEAQNRICPLTFVTQRGQRIEVTLYSFGQYRAFDSLLGSDSLQHLRPCPVNAHVIENGRHHSNALCQSRQREQQIYTTNSSRSTIYFERNTSKYQQKTYANYVLKLQAVGCPDLVPSVNSWIERMDDRIIVRCNFSLETWYLTCKGTSWIGAVTNCSEALLPIKREITLTKKKTIPLGLVIAVIIGIIFGVVLGLVMLFLVYLIKRRRALSRQKTTKLNSLLDPEEVLLQQKDNEDNFARKVFTTSRQRPPPPSHIYSHVCPTHHSLACRHRCHSDYDVSASALDKRLCCGGGDTPHHVTPPPPPPLTAAETICQQLIMDPKTDTKSRRKHVQFASEEETTSNAVKQSTTLPPPPSLPASVLPLGNHNIITGDGSHRRFHGNASEAPSSSSADEVLCRPDLVRGGDIDGGGAGSLSLVHEETGSRTAADDDSRFAYRGPVLFDWDEGSCAFTTERSNTKWPT